MSEIRVRVVEIVKEEFGYMSHILRAIQNKHCVVFNRKELFAKFLDIKSLVNLFAITCDEIDTSEEEYEDVRKFIFFK